MKRSLYIEFIGMFLLFNFSFGQDCDSGYVWLEIPPSWDYDILGGIDSTNCFYENHINIIQNLINNNLESLDSIMDSNDDGVIEPLEFGGFSEGWINPGTQWSDGKLVSLFCNGSCGLSYLPENICDIINDTPFEYFGMWDSGFIFNDNNICPPIPTCIESYDPYDESVYIGFGFQDCLDCETFGSNYSYIDFDTIEGIDEVYNQYIFFDHQSNTNCYSQSEIDFLDEIINTNSSLELIVWLFSWGWKESVSGIHPLQLGGQIWENGRLKEICWGEIVGEPGWFSLSISHIPESIQNLEVLEKLNLSRNFLDSIPSSIVYLDNLIELNLSNNNLTGEIPSEIGNLTNLTQLSLHNNQLTGEIPPEICNQGDSTPYLENNYLCPPYPECLDEDDIGEQDTSECEDLSNSDIYPIEYSLNKPYPNPFNPSTTISFSVPSFDKVSINVYDLKGSLVTTVVDDYYHSGNHSINWDGGNYSSGNYVVKMKSSNYESSQIITLVK